MGEDVGPIHQSLNQFSLVSQKRTCTYLTSLVSPHTSPAEPSHVTNLLRVVRIPATILLYHYSSHRLNYHRAIPVM